MYLHCDCGSGEFTKWNKLKLSAAGGTVDEVGGWQCAKCLKKADTGRLIKMAEMQRRTQELKSMTEELESDAAIVGQKAGPAPEKPAA